MLRMEHRQVQTQKQTQQLMLTQKMQQALHILQLSGVELEQHIQQELENNPFLELVSRAEEPPAASAEQPSTAQDEQEFDVCFDLDDYCDKWDIKHREGQDLSYNEDLHSRRRYYEEAITQHESLRAHLLSQMRLAARTDTEYAIGERIIIGELTAAFPAIEVLAEESAATVSGGSCWIIDPLDGTTNFIHRYPQVGVSVALVEDKRIVLGVTYDPLRDELFEAVAGGGATCNGVRIGVSPVSSPHEALLGTGFPFRAHEFIDEYLAVFRDLFLGCRGIRRAGAAVLDLAHVAAGRLDGFWELQLKPWDMAAGALLVREAGGTVSDFFGSDAFLVAGNIVAAAPALHDWIVAAATRHFSPERVRGLANDSI